MNTKTITDSTQLTSRQQVFVAEYVVCRNGAEAARRAKYSVKTARQIASENLTKPDILEAIAAKEVEMSKSLTLDREAVIGGVFNGISVAHASNDAAGIIKGWLAVAKIVGLDKPETPKNEPLSTSNLDLKAKYEAMSDDELMAIINQKVA